MRNYTILSAWSIRKKLLLVLLIFFLPAGGLIIASGLEQRRHELQMSENNALLLVQSLRAQQEQIAIGIRQMLSTLATLPQVQRLDADACNELFRELNNRYPFYSTISAATSDGNLFAASAPFKPGSVNLSDRKHVKDAIRTLGFSTGEYIVGRVSKVPSINYTYPVFDANKNLVAVVIVGFRLDEYARFMAKANAPEGSVLVITDHAGVRLYRFPEDDAAALGKAIPTAAFKLMSDDVDHGVSEWTGEDTVHRIYAFSRLRLEEDFSPYLHMIVGIPKDRILHKANLEMLRNLIILGIAAATGIALAWVLGNVAFVKPISRLLTATQRFGSGEMNVRAGLAHTPDEVGQLAKSFDEMASLLEIKSLERKKIEEALQEAHDELEERVEERTAELQKVNEQLCLELAERKRAEEALGESEVRYRSLVESCNDWVWEVDRNGVYTYVSPHCRELLGYEPEELIGRKPFDLMPPDEARQIEETFASIAAQRKPFRELENTNRHKDGHLVVLKSNGVPVLDVEGNFRGYRGFDRDITKRRKMEERQCKEVEWKNLLLRVYETTSQLPDKELYDHILESTVQLTGSTVGFFHLVSDDQENIILTTWNSEALKHCTVSYVCQYPIEQAGNWVDCVRFKRPIVYNDFPNSPNRKGLPEGHLDVRRFMSVPVIEEDKVRMIFGVGNKSEKYDEHDVMQIQLVANELQSIIKQRRSHQELRESEERFRQLAENVSEVFWIANFNNSEVLYVSPAYERIWGRTCASVYANPRAWLDGIHPEDLARVTDALEKRGTGTHNLEYRIVHPDGSIRWILDRGFPVYNKERKVYRFAGIAEDITERKQMERERERLIEQAQHDTHTKAELLREINHRVKNNLMAILGLLLAEKQQSPLEGRVLVEKVVGNLNQRVRALLQVHQMLADSEWAPMRLSDVASRIIRSVIAAAPSDRQVVVKVLPSPTQVSPRQANSLAVVFTELATNTTRHGLLDAEVSSITVEVTMEDDLICIEYRDNGPGYPPEVLSGKDGNVGMKLIRQLITETLRGTVSLANENGAVTFLRIKTEEEGRT